MRQTVRHSASLGNDMHKQMQDVSLLYHTCFLEHLASKRVLRIPSIESGFVWWPGQESNLRPSR
jgi:hypothetical protein